MQDERGLKRIPLSRATNLPRLNSPAGYVIVIEDVELGDRFKIARLQEVNRRSLARVKDLAFETELFLVLSAANAAELALELQDRFAASGDVSEWFDLDKSQAAQLRDFGRPRAPSLRDLALSEVEGQSLVEKALVVSAPLQAPPSQARVQQKRPQRRWPAWLLLLAIVTLGASVLGNAPQLRRLLSGRTASPATILASPSPVEVAATSPPSDTAAVRAGDEFYVLVRANARVCASRECRAVVILNVGARIVAQGYESGESVGGNNTWIAFNRGGAILYVHSAVLSLTKPGVSSAALPSASATNTAVPSATFTLTDTTAPSSTSRPTATAAATSTAEPTETATATLQPTATATKLPAVLYIDTVNDLNANVRACPSTDCGILGRLRPGAEIRPTAEVEGEEVNGIALWIEFGYDGRTAYVHGELVAEKP